MVRQVKLLSLFLFYFGLGIAAEPCRCGAMLGLPAMLSSSSLSKVPAEITIRWKCEETLLLRVWGKHSVCAKDGRESIHGFPEIFTESGEKVKCWEPLAEYVPYDTEHKLAGDQELKLELEILGSADFKAAGRYYAVLELYGELANGNFVKLKTEKCWFTFVGEGKKISPHTSQTPSATGVAN